MNNTKPLLTLLFYILKDKYFMSFFSSLYPYIKHLAMNSFLYAQRRYAQRSDSQSFTHIIPKWAQPFTRCFSSRVTCPYLKKIKTSFLWKHKYLSLSFPIISIGLKTIYVKCLEFFRRIGCFMFSYKVIDILAIRNHICISTRIYKLWVFTASRI